MSLSSAERQRRYREHRYAAWAALPPIACACGCGAWIPPITKEGKPATFALGHNSRVKDGGHHRFQEGQVAWNKGALSPWASATHKGKRLSEEELASRKATRLRNNGGIYQQARGWKHSAETIERMRAANAQHARSGPKNHAWEGGVSFEPYDATFNRALKRCILKRDGHQCQDCGVAIGRRKGAKRANVHHLDHDKMNSSSENLISLCVSCHTRRHWATRKGSGTVAG